MRRAKGLLAVAGIVGGVVLGFAPSAPAAPGDSAITVSGSGPFADLRVTLSQTRDLINQTITVKWTGGAATLPNTGQFAVNYLQIMQCWGDAPAGPDRSQCLYGGSVTQSTPAAGAWVRSRQVNYTERVDPTTCQTRLCDPVEPYRPGDDPGTPENEAGQNVFVPFWPAGTERPTKPVYTGRNDFIDAQLTNEIPLARTRGNGEGLEFFEVQTARQSPGLGCGGPVSGGIRSCWLVIVPRGSSEVDGSDQSARELVSSPLSQTNWNHRIAVKLEFQPGQTACPIGAAERRLVGHELAVEAVSRWQPALCADGGGGRLFGFTQLSDDVARNQLLQSDSPALAMLSDPVPPDRQLPERPLVYAPLAVSGLAIAFFVERQVPPDASDQDRLTDGVRYQDLQLTPRLVAKLLTQSYRGSVVGKAEYLRNNPAGLADDQEFLDLNPGFRGFQYWTTVSDALVPLGTSDATTLLWRWVTADSQARAFIAGTPDEHGMVVNPNNKGVELPVPTYPRNDQSCYEDDPRFFFCTLDAHAFANDIHEAARAASRGDTLGRTASGTPNLDGTPKLTRIDRQPPGRRGVLAVVDAPAAARYGLPTAKLRNAAGEFVGPGEANLRSGVAAMTPSSVDGVLTPNPAASAPDAYPLTTLTYAVATPPWLTVEAGRDYASFLRYAVGAGQKLGSGPGELAEGYGPLPDPLRAQALAAAAKIESDAGKRIVPTEEAPPVQNPTGGDAGGPANLAGDSVPAPAAQAGAPAAAPQVPNGAPTVTQQPVAEVHKTPNTPVGSIRYALIVLLIGGCVAAASAPVLHLLSPRSGGPGGEAPPAGVWGLAPENKPDRPGPRSLRTQSAGEEVVAPEGD